MGSGIDGKRGAILAVIVLAAVSIAVFYLFQQPVQPGGAVVAKTYGIDYSGIVAEKKVEIDAGQHKETLRLSADAEILGFVIYTVVPKGLAADADEIEFTTNADIEVLETDPLLLISAKNSPNSIAVEMSFPNAANKDLCTVNAVMPAAFVNSLTTEQHNALKRELLTLDLDLNCDTANALESNLAGNLVQAFSAG